MNEPNRLTTSFKHIEGILCDNMLSSWAQRRISCWLMGNHRWYLLDPLWYYLLSTYQTL